MLSFKSYPADSSSPVVGPSTCGYSEGRRDAVPYHWRNSKGGDCRAERVIKFRPLVRNLNQDPEGILPRSAEAEAVQCRSNINTKKVGVFACLVEETEAHVLVRLFLLC